ncbi:hypothetical protein ABK040_002951 [Willaertia magna]
MKQQTTSFNIPIFEEGGTSSDEDIRINSVSSPESKRRHMDHSLSAPFFEELYDEENYPLQHLPEQTFDVIIFTNNFSIEEHDETYESEGEDENGNSYKSTKTIITQHELNQVNQPTTSRKEIVNKEIRKNNGELLRTISTTKTTVNGRTTTTTQTTHHGRSDEEGSSDDDYLNDDFFNRNDVFNDDFFQRPFASSSLFSSPFGFGTSRGNVDISRQQERRGNRRRGNNTGSSSTRRVNID